MSDSNDTPPKKMTLKEIRQRTLPVATLALGVAGTLGVVTALEKKTPPTAPTSQTASADTPPPPKPWEHSHYITDDTVKDAYIALEKRIKEELETAHKEGKKLKIIVADNHGDLRSYLVMLMTFDIARRAGVHKFAVEFPDKFVQQVVQTFPKDKKHPFVQADQTDIINLTNITFYALAYEKKNHSPFDTAPGLTYRGIDDEEMHAQAHKLLAAASSISEDELRNPKKWGKRHVEAWKEIDTLNIKRDAHMAQELNGSINDQIAVCGVGHVKGICEQLDAKQFRSFAVTGDNLFRESPEEHAFRIAHETMRKLDNNGAQKLGISTYEFQGLKDAFAAEAKNYIKEAQQSPYFSGALNHVKNHACHPFSLDLSPDVTTTTVILEMLRKVQRTLHPESVVMAVPQLDLMEERGAARNA